MEFEQIAQFCSETLIIFYISPYGIRNRRARRIYFSFADIHIVAPQPYKPVGEANSWHRDYD